jgi:hypothetical protein
MSRAHGAQTGSPGGWRLPAGLPAELLLPRLAAALSALDVGGAACLVQARRGAHTPPPRTRAGGTHVRRGRPQQPSIACLPAFCFAVVASRRAGARPRRSRVRPPLTARACGVCVRRPAPPRQAWVPLPDNRALSTASPSPHALHGDASAAAPLRAFRALSAAAPLQTSATSLPARAWTAQARGARAARGVLLVAMRFRQRL